MMDSSREERRLQRQRGAQRHQVQDVDFGSPFPTAAVSQRVTRSGATPQPDLPSQPSNRRTPATRGRGGTSNARSTQKSISPTATPAASDVNRSANTSAKRRKLDTPQDAVSSSPTRSARSRATLRADLYDVAEEEPAAESVEKQTVGQTFLDNAESGEELDQVQLTQTPKSQRVTNLSSIRADEITESPQNAPGSGQRQQVTAETIQMPGVKLFENEGRQVPTAQMTEQSAGPSTKFAYRRSPRNREMSSAADEVDELSPDRPSKSRLEFQQVQYSDVEEEEEEQAKAIDDIEAAHLLQKKRKRKSSNEGMEWEAEVEEHEVDDEEPDEPEPSPEPVVIQAKPVKQTKSKAKASPAAQRQPKKKSKSKSTSRKSGETIPVVVHRLTKPVIYGEDDTDADLLNEDIPFAKRSGVNAVDVLSQFCEEVIESGLAALDEGGANAEDAATRKEYRTKLRAVEAFQEELRTRLLELTVILDADYLLNKRVKAAQKEKIELRENLLRLRAEREKLALRMDEVRIKHENSSKEAQERAALSTALHDIELAVSRGLEKGAAAHEPAQPDLSILLRTVAGEVSSNSPEGGTLKQVKEFNAFLERAALALEAGV